MLFSRRYPKWLPFTVIGLIAAIGIYGLVRSFAATNSVTYSGKLSPKSPSASYTIAVSASGSISSSLSYSKLSNVSLKLLDPTGALITTATGPSPINLSAVVAAGNYKEVITGSGSGNYSLTTTYPVPGDTTAPTISISTPSSGSTVTGTITVSGTANDNVAVSQVQVSVDGGAYQPASGTTSWSYSLNTTTLPNGVHNVTARAVDSSNNMTTTTASYNVSNSVADTTPPTVSITSPTNGSTVSGTITVTGTAGDNVALTSVQIQIDSNPLATASGTSNWTYSLNTTTVTNGVHSLTALARDTSGNVTKTSLSITINNSTGDTINPNVSITSPANGATVNAIVSVTGMASDNVAVAKVELQVDNGVWSTASGTASWSWTWDARLLANGNHTLTARATDSSGNTGTTTISLTVNNYPHPLTTCSDGSAVLQQSLTPENVRIVVCTAVGGWTSSSIYSLLKPNALDLSLIGPHLTIQVETGQPSSEGSSGGCCDASGRYNGYSAMIVLNPSSSDSFGALPDAIMAHEYGHAWTYYWYFLNPANNGSWGAYDNFRWAAPNGTQVLSQNANLNTNYNWMDYEMAADDYRRLFGTPAAQSQLTFLNAAVPDSQQVTGLANWFTSTWK